MIVDTLANAARYAGMHPGFARAFQFLATTDLAALPPGRHDIDGDRLFVLIDHKDGRGEDGARLEAHRRYIDIQYTFEGDELIGWMPLTRCTSPDGPFDETKDVVLLRRPAVDVRLGAAGQFHDLLSARRARAAGRPRPPEEGRGQDRRGSCLASEQSE